jgi:hypothetical protein
MAKRIKVRGIPRSEPDIRLYALALIELAHQLQDKEAAAKNGQDGADEPPARGPGARS